MRRSIIICIIILGGAISSKCQEWYQIGAEWYFNYEVLLQYPAHGYIKYSVEKDTLLESHFAKLIVRTRYSFIDGSISDTDSLYVREENEQIFLWNGTNYNLMYDFSLNIGDTLEVDVVQRECDSISPIVVDSITSLEIDNIILEVQHLSYSYLINSQYETTTKSIIEYIGQIEDFLFQPACGIDVNGWGNNLLRCYSDNDISYKSDWWTLQYPNAPCDTTINGANWVESIHENNKFSIFPNPCNDILNINHPTSAILSISIFNASGQLLSTAVPRTNSTQINLDQYNSGLYHIFITTENESVSKSIIKK